MDVERDAAGWHFRLGPVERWIVGILAVLFVAMGSALYRGFTTRLDLQGDRLTSVMTQQAVTNAQLETLSTQLSGVPSLVRELAELKVQVQRNTEDIKELRSERGTRG